MSVRRIAGVVLAATLIVVSATVAPIVQVGAASDRSGSSRDRSSASPVVVSTDTVDLTVTDIRLSPSSPSVEETVEICADIENRGDTTADDVELKFYVDGEFQFIPPTSTVGPGETEDACVLTATFSEGGSHTLTARVDPDDHIAETDEQNNALDTTVTVEREFGVVEGRVTDEGGSPIEGVRVMTDGEQQVTDSEGYYRFEEVTAGTRTVEAYITDYVNEETRIELTDGETERVDFSLARETFTVETSIEPSRSIRYRTAGD